MTEPAFFKQHVLHLIECGLESFPGQVAHCERVILLSSSPDERKIPEMKGKYALDRRSSTYQLCSHDIGAGAFILTTLLRYCIGVWHFL
ncbi:MAG: hypothetical protein HXS40_08560 [Theionarchaea archaeon]|nr:hypothetical protein [Theionarchaea archaeon]